jgi:hypothetical protein
MRKALSLFAILVAISGGVVLGYNLRHSKSLTLQPIITPSGPLPTYPLAGKIQAPPKGDIYWGAFRQGAPYDTSLVQQLADQVGYRPAIVMWYQEWWGQPDFPTVQAAWLYDEGIVPMISWEPWRPPTQFGALVVNQPQYRLSRIAGGAFDSYITKYAEQIKAYGGPVIMRPFHEMDGFWYPWGGTVNGNTPAEFVAAWRHIWDIFNKVGASNVTWIWSVNHISVPDTANNQIQDYWPGSKYVDWVGYSGFNWGTSSPLSTWAGFDAVYQQRYQDLLQYGKPIMITEMGCPEVGGNKAEWITQAFQTLKASYPQISAVVWYDKADSALRQWQIDSSAASLAAFKSVISQPWVLSANAAQMTALSTGEPSTSAGPTPSGSLTPGAASPYYPSSPTTSPSG